MNKLIFLTLESNCVHHCFNRCVGCTHFSPISAPQFVSVESLKRDLDNLSKLCHVHKFVLLGGEPLLHPNLLEMIHAVKASGIADTCEILTNGTLLDRQPDSIWQTIDSIQVSAYAGKLSEEQIHNLFVKSEKFNRPLQILPKPQFLKCYYKTPLEGREIQDNFDVCDYKRRCLTVQDGYFYHCPQSWKIPTVFLGKEYNYEGFKIEGSTIEDLYSYFNRDKAFESCARCVNGLGKNSKWYPWRECSKEEWMEESAIW